MAVNYDMNLLMQFNHPKNPQTCFSVCGSRHLQDCFHFVQIYLYSLLANNKTKQLSRLHPKCAFTKFTHTSLKHHHASQRINMECAKREKREFSDHLFDNFTLLRKDFSFVKNFVNSSKSETQHGIQNLLTCY